MIVEVIKILEGLVSDEKLLLGLQITTSHYVCSRVLCTGEEWDRSVGEEVREKASSPMYVLSD